jgi:hypothetical protein
MYTAAQLSTLLFIFMQIAALVRYCCFRLDWQVGFYFYGKPRPQQDPRTPHPDFFPAVARLLVTRTYPPVHDLLSRLLHTGIIFYFFTSRFAFSFLFLPCLFTFSLLFPQLASAEPIFFLAACQLAEIVKLLLLCYLDRKLQLNWAP